MAYFQSWKRALHWEYAKRERHKNNNVLQYTDWSFESICLGSDNHKARGKYCTVWPVTACNFTPDKDYVTSWQSQIVFTRVKLQISLCLAHIWVRNFYIAMLTLFCFTDSYLLLIFLWRKKNHWYLVFADPILKGMHLKIPSNRTLLEGGRGFFESPHCLGLLIDYATIQNKKRKEPGFSEKHQLNNTLPWFVLWDTSTIAKSNLLTEMVIAKTSYRRGKAKRTTDCILCLT